MAYQFPLNGGRINASIGGNSTSAGAGYSLVSTGTLHLMGGNNITLSQNGQSISIVGGAGGGGNTANLYVSSNSTQLSSTAGIDLRSLTFQGAGAASFGVSEGKVLLSAPEQSSLSHTGAVSISRNGNTISIGAPVQTNQSLGFSAGSNTTLTSTGTFDARSMWINGHGGVSAGFSNSSLVISAHSTYAASNHSHGDPTLNLTNLSGTTASASNGLTLSLSAAAQSAQTGNFYVSSNSTQLSSTAGVDLRSITFQGAGGASIGLSQGKVLVSVNSTYAASNHSHGNPTLNLTNISGTTASASNGLTLSLSAAAQTAQTGNFYVSSNSTQLSSTAGVDLRSLTFQGAGGVSVGVSEGKVLISGGAAGGGGVAMYDGANSITSGTARFSNSNGVSFGINGQTITASHNGITSQTNQSLGLYGVGNTTGESSSSTFDARTLSFQGAGAASVGYSNGSVVISAPNAAAGNVTFSAGANSAGLASLVFSNSNNVSFGLNGSTITASAAGGGGGVALYDGANSITSGTASLLAGGALTASVNGQTLSLNAPALSSLSATGVVSISTNGNTISIGVPNNNATVSRYIYPNEFQPISTATIVNNSISFNYVSLDQDVSANQFRALYSVSNNTHTSASTNTYGLTMDVAIYTRNGSTITNASSGSQTWSGTYSTNQTASLLGVREFTIPMNMNMTPGEYWFAHKLSSSSVNASIGYSLFVVGTQQTAHLAPGRFGAATNASQLLYPWHGLYTATSAAMPASATLGHVAGNGVSGSRAMYWFDVRNYTVL